MDDLTEDKRLGVDKLRDQYRLVVFTSDTFKEVKSFDLSIRSIYTIITMVSIILIIGFFSLFAFTPLKRIIPGYGDLEANAQFLRVIEKVDLVIEEIEAQDTYIAALRTALSVPNQDNKPSFISKSSNVKRAQIKTPDIAKSVKDNSFFKASVDNGIYDTWHKAKVIPPVQGLVSSKFTPEIKHFGVDILAPQNSPINVIMDGFVFSSGWDLETGYTIGVQHEGNILSFYKHNSILLKEKGTFVEAGEAIAIIGNTGTLSSGPHLHFELWHSGKPVNPEDFLNF